MPIIDDKIRLQIWHDVSVLRNGVDLGERMGSVTRKLLAILGKQHPAVVSREQIVHQLYGAEDVQGRAALRQVLRRLKDQIGEDVFRTTTVTIGLRPDTWEVDFREVGMLETESKIQDFELKSFQSAHPVALQFKDLVLGLAQYDRVEARQLVISQANMARCLPYQDMHALLAAVKPEGQDEPLAGEFRNIESLVMLFGGAPVPTMLKRLEAVKRYAGRRRNRAVLDRARAYETFIRADSGTYAGSVQQDLSLVRNTGFHGGLAHAALLWNDDQPEAAAEVMFSLASRLASEPDSVAMHYWCNLTVFAAVPSLVGAATDAEERVRQLPGLAMDFNTQRCLMLARARRAVIEQSPEVARRAVASYQAISRRFGWVSWDAYEVLAECDLMTGDLVSAKRNIAIWKKEHDSNGRDANRRFMRQYARLRSLAAHA